MEESKSIDEDDNFFDSFDEFPFYDCPDSFSTSSSSPENSISIPQSTLSLSSTVNSRVGGDNLRRRRYQRKTNRDSINHENEAGKLLELDSLESTSNNVVDLENSTVTMEERRENDDGEFSLLVFLAELVIKAIGFQFNLLITLITFPFSALYYGVMLFINPFFVIRVCRNYMVGKIMKLWNIVCDTLSPFLSEWINEHKYWIDFVLRFGWGIFWSIYVCCILVSLLMLAFVIGGLMMRFYIVEEPFQLKQPLNFDYTKTKPEAFVPITSCRTMECGEKINGLSVGTGLRVIPRNQKMEVTVILVLPESDYNRNLGIFQVRVDFLSENGKSLTSLSHPCMLGFKSEPLRILLTFFKIVPLVAGYLSESQTIILKFRGYTETAIPSGCVKVTIEQRAEFRSGAGIPEVYDAFLQLESQLPFLKRILWYWRKTIFVWFSMMLFVVELLFTLLCCQPLILPRGRTRDNTVRNRGDVVNHSRQRQR